MCDVIARAMRALPEYNRRSALKIFGAGALGVGLTATGLATGCAEGSEYAAPTAAPIPPAQPPPSPTVAAPAQSAPSPTAAALAQRPTPSPTPAASERVAFRTRLVTLGTAGGPVMNPDRHGISTAVVFDERVYIVDLGNGSLRRLQESGLGFSLFGIDWAVRNVAGLFFTHLHNDHTVDWPAMYLIGDYQKSVARILDNIQVFGPAARDTLPAVFPPGRQEPELINPDNPTPGIADMTGYLQQAFAFDFNDRARDQDLYPWQLFDIHEIDHSPFWAVDPTGVPPRLSAPIDVWEDGDVKVTATLVKHPPTAPSYAFRFDTPDGSIVVSGDTAVSENLIDLAQGADYLVHEVLDMQWAEQTLISQLPPEQGDAVREHMVNSHTTIEQVGRDVAEPAGAKNLVLTHFAPAHNPVERWMLAQEGYSGNLIVGHDLMEIAILV